MEKIIKSDFPPEKYTLELQPKHFEKSYALSILELSQGEKKFYYIENLVDLRGISAKFAFAKLASQFEDTLSARNNYIFKYILNEIVEPKKKLGKKITDKQKHLVDEFLKTATLKMSVYPVLKFDYSEISQKTHKVNLKLLKEFEKQVVRLFATKQKTMINAEIPEMYVRYDDIQFPKIWHQIKTDFYL